MNDAQQGGSRDVLLTLTQAVREAQGKISYPQLWRGIRAGRITAFQPGGKNGSYSITRAELERVLTPVIARGK